MSRVFERILQQDLNLGTGSATKTAPGGGTLTGTQIGIHSFAVGGAVVAQAWTPGVIPAGGQVTTTVSVPGAQTDDLVLRAFSASSGVAGLILTADVISTGVVQIVLANLSGAPVTVGLGSIRVLVLQSR